MSAGYIQLVALGQQDVYLTGEPQVTYFSGMYKRHTPFVLEAYDVPFNDQYVTYGGMSICRIPPKGDLIRGLTLKMTLPALYNPGADWTWPTNPSVLNVPTLWFGRTDGTIVNAQGSYNVPYYSTNGYSSWASSFFPADGTYNGSTNFFNFSHSVGGVGLANVIVQSTFSSNNAGSGVFWGFDPVNYDYQDQYGNLVYVATSNTVVPDFTLQQAGWVQTQGLAVNTFSGFYANLLQNYQLSPGVQFLNLGLTVKNSPVVYSYDSGGAYIISNGGALIFNSAGFYLIRAGFNLDSGSVQSLSYTIQTTDMSTPPVIPTSFTYTTTFTVSPSPSSPALVPIYISGPNSYVCLFINTNSSGSLVGGTYLSVSYVNDTYQLANDVTLQTKTAAQVPLFGNILPYSNSSVVLTQNSMLKFQVNGEYLVSGVLSVSNTATEQYIQSVSIGERANILYTYDMSQQGRNPTYGFSMPLVANTQLSYYINVTTQSAFSNLAANSFFSVTQVGVQSDTAPSIIVPYNGLLLQSNSTMLQTPLNLASNFTSNGNATASVTLNPQGNLVFANVASYMLTGVFYTANPVTNVIITNSHSNFIQYYNPTLAYSSSPPYTISIPFQVSDNAASYGVTLVTTPPGGTVYSGTYLAVSELASNTFSGNFGQIYSYNDSVGTLAITNADLRIGGQTIQSITGEYIETWNELNVPYENQPGLQLLTGKYDTITSIAPPGRTYYVNLPFYFYGNPELSIPIVALDRQDVEVWVTFNNFSNLTSVSVTNPTLSATIITEYAYLSNPEIDWFQSQQLDYVITQCQYESFILPQNLRTSIFNLKFKNPIKELFFIVQPSENIAYDYSGNGVKSLGMSFNGEDVFLTSTTNNVYIGSLEPFLKHVNFFSKPPQPQQQVFGRQFYMYSFSKNPFGVTTSGQVNFSRIQQVLLELNLYNQNGNYPQKNFRIIGINQNILRIANGIAGIMFH